MTMEELIKMLQALTPEQKTQAMAALGGQAPAPGGQPGGAPPAGGHPPPQFGKRLDPEVEAYLAKSQKDAAEALEKRDEALKKQAEMIEKLQAESEISKSLDAVKKEFPRLAGDPIGLAKILRKADRGIGCDKDDATELRRILASYEGLAKQGEILSKQLGSRNATVIDGSPLGKLQAIAKGLQEKNDKLTEAQAFELAARQNPSLYSEHRNAGA